MDESLNIKLIMDRIDLIVSRAFAASSVVPPSVGRGRKAQRDVHDEAGRLLCRRLQRRSEEQHWWEPGMAVASVQTGKAEM